MIFMLTINLALSIIFMILTHPLSLGMILLLQTTMISLITGTLNLSFWYSYILFLIMIGGMMILFIYMTSIASNEKFTFNFNIMLLIILSFSVMIAPILMKFLILIFLPNEDSSIFNINQSIYLSMIKYLNLPSNLTLSFMIIYLFLTLIATVKITNFSKGPLRPQN
uniref:NADH-ubiquinone oxidoreductase chain 6 n=1 Tax=Ischnomera caerulea TaxID=295983 RepID=A0A0S2MQ62_9CUCU|nr:NADH deshydrogenase subunit 6 [Ischnomera caerulea]